MSRSKHARTPRFKHWWNGRLVTHACRRPEVPKRVAIAQQVAAMLEDLDDTAADLAVPECTDGFDGFDALAHWERELLSMSGCHLSLASDPGLVELGAVELIEIATLAGLDAQTAADAADSTHWAQEMVRANDEYYDGLDDWVHPEDDEPSGEPWMPLMSYSRVVAELGDGFMLTGPNRQVTGEWPAKAKQGYLRVYQLARLVDLPSRDVIALLRERGEYVACHQSWIAEPAARDFREALTKGA